MGNKKIINDGNKYSLDKILNVASTEYVKWICNTRILLYFSMLIFLGEFVIKEYIRVHNKMHESAMVFEPFISIGNSSIMLLILPAVFLTIMGDFPKTDGNTMFYIQRTGKKNWIIGQLIFAIYADISFLGVTSLLTIIVSMPFSNTSNSWSRLITHFGREYPEEAHSRITEFIDGRIYNNMKPYNAFALTFAMLFLYLLLISVILMVSFTFGKRLIGIAVSCCMMAIGIGLVEMKSSAMWFFPTGNAIMWSHYDRILKKQIFSIRNSYLYFLISIVLLITASFISIRRYDFAKITDMED